MVSFQMEPDAPTLADIMTPLSLDDIARKQIRHWIEGTGITQATLADRIGRNQAWMSRYLKGEFDADLTTLDQMARVFNHTVAALLNVPDDPEVAQLVSHYRACRPEARAWLSSIAAEMSRAARVRSRSRR
jgi:transcriptional regulator with XRE-family HTH domain